MCVVDWKLVLEYLKVILSAPVIFGALSAVFLGMYKEEIRTFIKRMKIKWKDAELSSQAEELRESESGGKAPAPTIPSGDTNLPPLPASLTADQRAQIETALKSERAVSYLWEYRYLNHFLVPQTQVVLDWFAGLRTSITYRNYDTEWIPRIPSAKERDAIWTALQAHHLISVNDELASITEKGKEYIAWRNQFRRPPDDPPRGLVAPTNIEPPPGNPVAVAATPAR